MLYTLQPAIVASISTAYARKGLAPSYPRSVKHTMDFDALSATMRKWQSTLRLNDWDIKLELVTKAWRKTGDVKIDQANKVAIVLINACNPKQTNIEAVIIHELLHIKLWGMDQMIEALIHAVYGDDEATPQFSFAYTQFMELLECTTQDLTKGYVALGAEDKSASYGRIQQQADDEWKGRQDGD